MTDKIDTKKLKDALDHMHAGLANSMHHRGGPTTINVYVPHLETVVAAARTLLPPVLEYWRIEYTIAPGGQTCVCTLNYDNEREALEAWSRIDGKNRRMSGPHTWDIKL